MGGKEAFDLFHWAAEVTFQPWLAAGSWQLAVLPLKLSVVGLSPVAPWPSLVLLLNCAFAEPIDQLCSGCAVAVTWHY